MSTPAEPRKIDPQQEELASGTPPARTPTTPPDTDVQPDQQPNRDTSERVE